MQGVLMHSYLQNKQKKRKRLFSFTSSAHWKSKHMSWFSYYIPVIIIWYWESTYITQTVTLKKSGENVYNTTAGRYHEITRQTNTCTSLKQIHVLVLFVTT
jgi:hypothetical protein